ncbi:MAG: hypothetical protein HW391_657 [Chloroflexi bacterium]|nr:hypothetical protein [Chloroflexota bacterium]
MSPTTIALVGLVALLVLLPTRRLQLAGWSRQSLTAYFLGLWLLGSLVAALPSPARFLIPLLLVIYLAPFVTLRDGINRLLGRPPRAPDQDAPAERPPVKNITPPGDQPG